MSSYVDFQGYHTELSSEWLNSGGVFSKMEEACRLIISCYGNGGKVLACGNGGSASDCEHLVGELMKAFRRPRSVDAEIKRKLVEISGDDGVFIGSALQGAIPAISLVSQSSLISAIANDVDPLMIFAQQVYGYGKEGDVLIGFSTSGNSKNVVYAVKTANALGLKTIGFTGKTGGELSKIVSISINAPSDVTHEIQEMHLTMYHMMCSWVEEAVFDI